MRRFRQRGCIAFGLGFALLHPVPVDAAQTSITDPPTNYSWHLPPGFPKPAIPAGNPMSAVKVELGRRLFYDSRLSVNGQYSCASCHQPAKAFTDGRARAVGTTGQSLNRATMTLTNVAYNAAFTWANPHTVSLESQMLQPLFNQHPVELGLSGREHSVLRGLTADPLYRKLFSAAFTDTPPHLSLDHLIKAIAAFERTLLSGRSPFDRYVFDDDRTAMSPAAKRGMSLFFSARGGCSQCHSGINFSGPIIYEGHEKAAALFADNGLRRSDASGPHPPGDRSAVTHKRPEIGKFRVPTLRNIALTGPYMHDGSMATLKEVIEHYARIRPLQLSSDDEDDLIQFLKSLTDREFVEDPRFQQPR